MAKTRYVKKANGQFAGALPGKVVAPTAQPGIQAPATIASRHEEGAANVATAYRAFAQGKRDEHESPTWLTNSPFSLQYATISEDYAVVSDYTMSEDMVTRGDRSRSVMVKEETADLLLRAEQVTFTERAPGLWQAVYVYPTYGYNDGVRIATQVSRGDFGSSQVMGVYTEDGRFIPEPDRFSASLSEQIGSDGCPLSREVSGYVNDWQYRTATNTEHEVTGLHIRATCEPVDVPDEDLVDPDSAWDSRFD